MITDQEQRALVFLAAACRPHGARRWQTAGIAAAVAKVAHLGLAEVSLAVIRAASDRNAETPGVIPSRGPHWEEGAFQPAWQPEVLAPSQRCSVCSHGRHDGKCPRCAPNDDHPFVAASDAADRKRTPEAMAAIVEDARQRLAPTAEPAQPIVRTPDPRIDAIRTQLANPTKETAVTDQTNSIETADSGKEDVA